VLVNAKLVPRANELDGNSQMFVIKREALAGSLE
jgi:hypothetical protein